MPEEGTAAAPAATGDPVIQSLAAAFEAQENPAKAETSAAETPEVEVTPETVDDTAPPPEEPEKEEPAADEEEETDEGEAKAEETVDEEEEADTSPDILTAEEIEEKFSRSNTKEGRAYMAKVSEIARQGRETVEALGGEPFIEPLKVISHALQDPTPENLTGFYTGITEASGVDTLVSVLASAVYMGFTKADEWAAKPETAAFGSAIQQIVNDAVEQKFGVSPDRLQKMAEWDSVGWFDKLDEWVTNSYVPEDELAEMLEINSNPTLKKLAQENQSLKQKRTEAKAESGSESVNDAETDKAFNEFSSEQVVKEMNKTAWAKSPLRDIPSDSAELKSYKAYFRGILEKDAIAEFNRLSERSKLLEGFKSGHSGTATYKVNLAKAIEKTINATKAQADTAEAILAKIYGKSRNAKLVTTKVTDAGAKPSTPAIPTQTTNFAPRSGEVKSIAEIQKSLEEGFKQFG